MTNSTQVGLYSTASPTTAGARSVVYCSRSTHTGSLARNAEAGGAISICASCSSLVAALLKHYNQQRIDSRDCIALPRHKCPSHTYSSMPAFTGFETKRLNVAAPPASLAVLPLTLSTTCFVRNELFPTTYS